MTVTIWRFAYQFHSAHKNRSNKNFPESKISTSTFHASFLSVDVMANIRMAGGSICREPKKIAYMGMCSDFWGHFRNVSPWEPQLYLEFRCSSNSVVGEFGFGTIWRIWTHSECPNPNVWLTSGGELAHADGPSQKSFPKWHSYEGESDSPPTYTINVKYWHVCVRLFSSSTTFLCHIYV